MPGTGVGGVVRLSNCRTDRRTLLHSTTMAANFFVLVKAFNEGICTVGFALEWGKPNDRTVSGTSCRERGKISEKAMREEGEAKKTGEGMREEKREGESGGGGGEMKSAVP